MRITFAAMFAALFVLSIIAWAIQPRTAPSGKTPLVWISDDAPARREQIGLFNRRNPRLSLSLDPSDSGVEKVIVQSIAGVGPDLFDCYSADPLSAYVRSGIVWDVTGELRKRGIDIDRDVWNVCKPDAVLDGRVYGFITNASVNALWINREIFARASVPLPHGPWTWQEFLPLARRMTVRGPDGRVRQYGLLLDWGDWSQFVYQWGGRVYTPDGSRCVVDSPEAIAGVQFLHDLVYRYHVVPTPAEQDMMATQGGWGSGTITLFGAAKGAMALGGRWWLMSLRDYSGLRLAAVECPHGKIRVFRGGGKATLINKNSPRRVQAIAFLQYEDSTEYGDLINHEADGVSATIRPCYDSHFLHDPTYPLDDFNGVWRDVMWFGFNDQSSPYVNAQEALRILTTQIDLIKADQKPVAEALHDAAVQISAAIAANVADDPALRARYEAAAPLRARPPVPVIDDRAAAAAARAADEAGSADRPHAVREVRR
jgi:multiple sugar transport system substrate-binding protein